MIGFRNLYITCPLPKMIYIYINRDIGVPGFSSRFFSMIINNIFYWLTLLATTALAATDHYKTRKVGAANTPDYSIYFGKSYNMDEMMILNQYS